MKETILIVEDDESMRQLLTIMLGKEGYEIASASSLSQGIELLSSQEWDLLISDLRLGYEKEGGIKMLQRAMKHDDSLPVIVITAYATVDTAIEAMKLGAYDYIQKPFKNDEFKLLVKRALEKKRLKDENKALYSQLKKMGQIDNLIGTTEVMVKVKELIKKVVPLTQTVLILGESGTGKELVARAIHNLSPRASRPMVAINCGGIPETLLESELFGHVKGAFTGAYTNKKGLFEVANGGTVFLDEIGELKPMLQGALLRVLDEKKIRPVGSSQDYSIDVRLISATNRNLDEMVKKGEFREDLFYRLNVIPIYLPSLRERREDIPLLLNHFLQKYIQEMKKPTKGITQEAMGILMNYDWPGNIRELENTLQQALALAPGEVIGEADLPERIRQKGRKEALPFEPILPKGGLDLEKRVEEFEKSMLTQAMERGQHSHVLAGKLLNLSPRALRYKLEKYGLKGHHDEVQSPHKVFKEES